MLLDATVVGQNSQETRLVGEDGRRLEMRTSGLGARHRLSRGNDRSGEATAPSPALHAGDGRGEGFVPRSTCGPRPGFNARLFPLGSLRVEAPRVRG